MSSARILGFILMLALAGGGSAHAKKKKPKTPEPVVADWKQVVTPRDMDRIRNWRNAFVKALASARAGGNAHSMAYEGKLLDPDASLGGDAPPAGRYKCRVVKVGAAGAGGLAYVVYPDFACSIADEGEVKSFAKTGGSQRPVGLIFKGDAQRSIFLGTMMLGDEKRAIDYGRDAMRDMAGAVERIGENRWRLILPYPSFESVMDVIEIVPA
jgi:hypothetical protein